MPPAVVVKQLMAQLHGNPQNSWRVVWGPTAPNPGTHTLVVCWALGSDDVTAVPFVVNAAGNGLVQPATISSDFVIDCPEKHNRTPDPNWKPGKGG